MWIHQNFGLSNATQTFQWLINEVLYGLPFTFAYIDDILIASKNMKEHYKHTSNKFLNDSHSINTEKCIIEAKKKIIS